MENANELITFLEGATKEDARNNLSSQGIAWSIMRVNGVYSGRTHFLHTLETDLLEYAFSLLGAALDLKELGGDAKLVNKSFELAGRSFESLLTNCKQDYDDKGFLQIIAACCYHLSGFSAIAFSIINSQASFNNNTAEVALRFLILRNLKQLRNFIESELTDENAIDDNIANEIKTEQLSADEAIVRIANDSICRALAFFDFALQTGNETHTVNAKHIIKSVISLTSRSGFVTLWWIARISLNLIDDLWRHSLHQNLPTVIPDGGEALYTTLRKKFILTLYSGNTSEVELWPSQMEAAIRSTNVKDDLVVALPTSAGKTRIAEIAALVTLSTEKRIVIVTPLRALSAQTERSFRRTFSPLGYSVSSLYGASGMSPLDEDSLKGKNIVIATPEKLDFALRNDSSILNDVGLIILDEGHMIGPTEREIRFEILVQRLLRRNDSNQRRIVCLSAILPDGENLNNFTQWLRNDKAGSPIKFPWRPTRQRFGTLVWDGRSAVLNFDYKSSIPFLHNFIEEVAAISPDQNARPRDLNEKTIFAAWKFASQGKRTLIFVTQANWVEKFGTNALKLVKRGYLNPLLEDRKAIESALSVGEEWLGKEHPAVKALEIGVAVHHGGLPNPFLRELELLLSKGIINITVASPTLSQGLNINAAVLLVPYLVRAGKQIKGEEFANVAGRAGRAFVDMEGFVIHVIHDKSESRKNEWKTLINKARERNLSSGLFQVIASVYDKLSQHSNLASDAAFEYLASKREAWFSDATKEGQDEDEVNNDMDFLVEKLDATVLGLIEALETDSQDLARLLDEALKGSLWARQVSVLAEPIKNVHLKILLARAKLIWSSTTAEIRRGHFAMGVGFDTGLVLDNISVELEKLMDIADNAAMNGNTKELTDSLISLAEMLLPLRPFHPQKALPANWKTVLVEWISGKNIDEIGSEFIPHIEDVFSYKLVWAIEAIRMKRVAKGWVSTGYSGAAAACIENGVPDFKMAMLIRAGLPSRSAAIKAVVDGHGQFNDNIEMYIWLRSKRIRELNLEANWPTLKTYDLWQRFYRELFNANDKEWELESKEIRIEPKKLASIEDGEYRVIMKKNIAKLYTPDFKEILVLTLSFKEEFRGVLSAKVHKSKQAVYLERFGPGRFIGA